MTKDIGLQADLGAAEARIYTLEQTIEQITDDHAIAMKAAEERGAALTDALKNVASISHHGGLMGMDELKALTEIRKLTVNYWDQKEYMKELTQ